MLHHRDDEFNKRDTLVLTLIFLLVGTIGTLVVIFILSGFFNMVYIVIDALNNG